MWKYVKLRGIVEDHKKEKHEEAVKNLYYRKEEERDLYQKIKLKFEGKQLKKNNNKLRFQRQIDKQ